MNSDAVLSNTYYRRTLKRLTLFGVLLATLLYSTLAVAQILGTGHLNVERRSHTATLLENGKVLIVGGDNQNGIVSQAEIFDPVSQVSALAAALITSRTDHSATRLSDGRVLVIGGRDQTGSLQSTEFYNPVTTSFIAGPAMMRARSGHTATILANDKILVTGGDLFGSAEIYDPETQSFSLVTGSLNTARKYHSGILLQNGQVMIVGGVNAQEAMLNTAEVFDPASQTFYLPPTDMQTARAFATLKLLPDGKVQIIGGDAELSMEVFDPRDGIFIAKALLPPNADLLGATLSTQSRAALFSPSISQDPLLQGILTAEQLSLLDRADQSITELPERNQALVAGGVNSGGQVLNSAKLVSSSKASVTTDKTDYAPGQIVTITGSGFQANEQVYIYFHEFPEEYPDVFLSATANQQGSFVTADFAPQEIDIGRIFTLTAIGQSSGFTAQTAFKDARNWTITFAGSGSGSVTITPNTGTVNAPVSCGGTGTNAASQTVTSACAPNITTSANGATVTFTASAASGSTFIGWSGQADLSSSTCSGTTNPCTAVLGNSAALTVTFNGVAGTTLAVSPASGAYGGSTGSIAATLTRTSGGTAVSGKTISFTVNGGSIGTATTNGSGVATLSSASLSGINAGTYPTGIAASFAGDSGFQASSGTNSLTVNKKAASVTPNAAEKFYGEADPTLTGTLNGFLAADGVTATYSRTAGETVAGSPYTISAVLSPAAVLGNYEITYNTALFTIKKKAASVTPNAAEKFYGEADPTLTGTLNGFLAADGVTATYSRTAGETVAGSPYTINAVLSPAAVLGNYEITYNTALFTIKKKAASVTPNAAEKFYGEADPTLTGTLNGFLAADGVTATYSRTAGETVAGSPYTINAVLSPAAVLGNYEITYNTALFTIKKKAASVTPNAAEKFYGEADPTLTGTLNGFLAADGVTATYSRTAGETVAGSPYTINAVLSPAAVLGNYEITYNTALFTIKKKAASVTPNAAEKFYGEADPTLTGTLNGFLAADGVTATYSRTAGETVAGSPYTINAVLSPAAVLGNYEITYNTAVFIIKKKAASVTPNAAEKFYGEADPTLTGTLNGFLAADGVTATYSRTAGETVAGSPYTINAVLSPAAVLGNYEITYNTALFTIKKKAASVTPNAAEKFYGEADPTLTGTLNGFLAADGVTATYSRTAGETVAGSPYTINAVLSPAAVLGNYEITYNTALFTIKKKAASVTPNAAEKFYGEADPTLTGTLNGFLAADGVTATYSRTAGETVAGSPYTINAVLSPAAVLGNYEITYNTAVFIIKKKAASVTPNAAEKFYGEADPTLTGTLNGFLAADGVTATYSRTAGETVAGSPYTINAVLSPAAVLGNYEITYNTAVFIIKKKAASVTPNAAEKFYGEADPTLTGTLNGFLAADGVTATYSRTAGETVAGSPYTINAVLSPAAVLGNYEITYNTAVFIIKKKAASVTPNAAEKFYGEADPTLTGTLNGFLAADGVTATYSRTAGETVAGSPYTINAVLSPAAVLGNYEITYNTAVFIIKKKAASVTPNAAEKFYGEADPTLTGTLNGFLAADGVTATYSRTAGETVAGSPYTINAVLSPAAVLGNYEITYNTALFTINQRPITVTADPKTKTYNESDPALSYQVTIGSLAFSDAFTGALSRIPGELVGTYAIQQNTLSITNGSNYTLTYIGANLTITTGFAFNGFHSPIGGSVENGDGGSYAYPVKSFKLGSTIPVKFGASWNGGAALVTGIHTLQAIKYSNSIVSEPAIDATPTDAATTGNQFRLTSTDWHFNLSTKGNGFTAGTWLLSATLVDGSQHTVWISIKK